jgi:threonine dehydratase
MSYLDSLPRAAECIVRHINRIPVMFDSVCGRYLKWEHQQVTGSFRVRGALKKALSLGDWEQALELVSVSAMVVISGGNIQPQIHAEILARWGMG